MVANGKPDPLDVLIKKLESSPRGPSITPERAAKIRKARELGATYAQLMKAAKVSPPTISDIIKKRNAYGKPPYVTR